MVLESFLHGALMMMEDLWGDFQVRFIAALRWFYGGFAMGSMCAEGGIVRRWGQ